jgi:hypothetical protein
MRFRDLIFRSMEKKVMPGRFPREALAWARASANERWTIQRHGLDLSVR